MPVGAPRTEQNLHPLGAGAPGPAAQNQRQKDFFHRPAFVGPQGPDPAIFFPPSGPLKG